MKSKIYPTISFKARREAEIVKIDKIIEEFKNDVFKDEKIMKSLSMYEIKFFNDDNNFVDFLVMTLKSYKVLKKDDFFVKSINDLFGKLIEDKLLISDWIYVEGISLIDKLLIESLKEKGNPIADMLLDNFECKVYEFVEKTNNSLTFAVVKNFTPLKLALYNNDFDLVKKMISKIPQDEFHKFKNFLLEDGENYANFAFSMWLFKGLKSQEKNHDVKHKETLEVMKYFKELGFVFTKTYRDKSRKTNMLCYYLNERLKGLYDKDMILFLLEEFKDKENHVLNFWLKKIISLMIINTHKRSSSLLGESAMKKSMDRFFSNLDILKECKIDYIKKASLFEIKNALSRKSYKYEDMMSIYEKLSDEGLVLFGKTRKTNLIHIYEDTSKNNINDNNSKIILLLKEKLFNEELPLCGMNRRKIGL